jgi:arylsulfatase A-like enzyme
VIGRSLPVFLLVAAGFLAACSPRATTEQARPNIVLIMADDLGYETLSVNGSTSYRTPNLDALAATGMRFTHAHATPLCTPSRVQLMTGKYGFRNYIGFGLLDPGERTFGHLLREAGYRTGVFGKWQLYGNERQRRLARGRVGSLPQQAGFDQYALWQVEEFGSRYKNPRLDVLGEPARDYDGAYGPDEIIDRIERFMEAHRVRPFFVYYPMILPHSPYLPTPDDPDYAASAPGTASDPARFGGHVTYMDKLVGRVVGKIEQLGLRDNTLVLFIADNGTDPRITSMLGDRAIRGNKGFTTAAGTHVPMIASWPGTIAAGQVNDNLIDLTDFLPTLMEAAHSEVPKSFSTDGLSFYPQLIGTDAPVRSWVFCHYAPNWNNLPHRHFVHDREWKLYDDGAFYHIADDPDEQSPVGAADLSRETLEIKRRFAAVLDRMR